MLHCFIYLTSVFNVGSLTIYSEMNLPEVDILVDVDKGIILERVGIYSTKSESAILHTLISLSDFCQASTTTDLCSRSVESKQQNIIELATILSKERPSFSIPQYKKNDISRLINKNVNEFLSINEPGSFFSSGKSTFHYFDNSFYFKTNHNHSLHMVSIDNAISNQQVQSYSPKIPATVLLEQIMKNYIGFDFLKDEEIALFLSPVMSSIDKSYGFSSTADLLNEFLRLILSQTIHVLHSCTNHLENMGLYPPCLIISTLFVRPLYIDSATYTVYNLYPWPVVINQTKYVYGNVPTTFGLNSLDRTLIIWNEKHAEAKCSFSKFVQCEEEPIFMSLSSFPCLKQLLSPQLSTSNCEIVRTINDQPAIVNIVENIWLFYNFDDVKHCHLHSDSTDEIEELKLTDSSVLRLPCNTFLKCSDSLLRSQACGKRTNTVASNLLGIYRRSSIFQHSLTTLTNRLQTKYKAAAIRLLKQLQMDIDRNELSSTTVRRMTSNLLVYILLSLMFVITMTILKYVHIKSRQQIDKIEKEINKIVDVFSLNIDNRQIILLCSNQLNKRKHEKTKKQF